jgi:hypothetical protein
MAFCDTWSAVILKENSMRWAVMPEYHNKNSIATSSHDKSWNKYVSQDRRGAWRTELGAWGKQVTGIRNITEIQTNFGSGNYLYEENTMPPGRVAAGRGVGLTCLSFHENRISEFKPGDQ